MQEQVTVVPHLTIRGAATAYEFYQKAFGAEPTGLMNSPDGKVMHAALSIGGSPIYLVDEYLDYGGKSPELLGGSPVTIHLTVADCDAVFARAVEAGCTVGMPLEDQFWGDRYGSVIDPYGHHWSISTPKKTLTFDEIQTAMTGG